MKQAGGAMRSPKDSRYHMRKTPKLAKTSAALSCRQTQASSEGCWNPEQCDEWPGSGLCAGEALESLVPRQAVMGSLSTREHDTRHWWLSSGGFSHLHLLAPQQVHAGPALDSARPVSPEQGGRASCAGMRASRSPGADAGPDGRATDTADASDKRGSRRSGPHRRCAGSRSPPDGVPVGRASFLLGKISSHLTGGQNPLLSNARLSRLLR